jgi:hypothetical protein
MRYIMTGRIHPERADVSFWPQTWERDGGESISVGCESSQIVVRPNLPGVDDHVTAFVTADQVVQAVVSAFSFALGTGYAAELVQVLENGAASHVFGVRPGNLHFEPWQPMFTSAGELSRRDVFFRMALRDYARAIREVMDCAFLCYRGIEAIKSSFAATTGREGWADMHATLGTSRQQIEAIVKVFADPVRHGNWFSFRTTTSAQRNEMLLLTRDILSRYLRHAAESA